MDNYQRNLEEEKEYLEKTLTCLKKTIDKESKAVQKQKVGLVDSGRDMWENTVHFSRDVGKRADLSQYLSEIHNQTARYVGTLKRLDNFKKMIGSPYFGRFDFIEDGKGEKEKFYIGLHSLIDPVTNIIYVYDWRAPISSIFYRYEEGRASYVAPFDTISGDVVLKRQYQIQNSELKYFFDCSIKINDEILQEVLSRSSSAKMRNIVKTIQKEQDQIIRDTASELLMVQGVAGSGKTSVAMHRIAFMLYDGLKSNLGLKNFLIISPNTVFGNYISRVLPELGEENVEQITFDDIIYDFLGKRLQAETRDAQCEFLISSQNTKKGNIRKAGTKFKGSQDFVIILNRLLEYFERHMIPFEDVYYHGVVIETKQQLKTLFLTKKHELPMIVRMERIKDMIWNKIHPLRKIRLRKIEEIVQKSEGHDFEIKSFSRLLSMKETKILKKRLNKFTEVDYLKLYQTLFREPRLFFQLSRGLKLPEAVEEIISTTRERLNKGRIYYEDCAPLIYLKLRMEGHGSYSQIRQVVIDEGQDYYPMQYQVFNLLFKKSNYTILSDINQSLEKSVDEMHYKMITDILRKEKTIKFCLNKSYRSSYEISVFARKLLEKKQDDIFSFNRHEAKPVVVFRDTEEMILQSIVQDLAFFRKQGHELIAVICKTMKEADNVHVRLKNLTDIKLINTLEKEIQKGALVIPSYMAKGLEFDAVIIYDVNKENYSSEFDRRLLYIACTRALHRLIIYYTGEKSTFIEASF